MQKNCSIPNPTQQGNTIEKLREENGIEQPKIYIKIDFNSKNSGYGPWFNLRQCVFVFETQPKKPLGPDPVAP